MKSLIELQIFFDRSVAAIASWRKKGCPGFVKRFGRVYGDEKVIKKWLIETNAQKPGPKPPAGGN